MLKQWAYEGKYVNGDGERLAVACEPSSRGRVNDDGVAITVAIGNKAIWLTPAQADELAAVLRTMNSTGISLR